MMYGWHDELKSKATVSGWYGKYNVRAFLDEGGTFTFYVWTNEYSYGWRTVSQLRGRVILETMTPGEYVERRLREFDEAWLGVGKEGGGA